MSCIICTALRVCSAQYWCLQCWPTPLFKPNVRCTTHGPFFARLQYIFWERFSVGRSILWYEVLCSNQAGNCMGIWQIHNSRKIHILTAYKFRSPCCDRRIRSQPVRRRRQTGPRPLELDYLRTDFLVHCVWLLALKKIAARRSKLVGS